MQQVITNLLIGKVELRSEDSPDILPYSHERRVEKLVVPLGEELGAIQKTYIQVSRFLQFGVLINELGMELFQLEYRRVYIQYIISYIYEVEKHL